MAITSESGKLIFRKAERDLLRLASEHTPETVHSFRTTVRRLITLLEMASSGKKQKKLVKMLTRIRKRAGRVRDIDAQLAALRSLKLPLEPRRKTLLTQRLLTLRDSQEGKLGKLLKKEQVREICKRLRRANNAVELNSNSDPIAFARQLLAEAKPAGANPDEGLLRRYRVLVKRARYAVEFAPKSAEAGHFLSQLRRTQDALGNWHDWFLLTQSAAEYLGDMNRSSLVAALQNVTRGKFRNAVREISAAETGKPAETPSIMASGRKTDSKGTADPQSAAAAA